jgi:hypothetical protein
MVRAARAVVLWALLAPAAAVAQAATEHAVKAAFLYKFAGYVEWPDSAFAAADAPFVIAVAGADEVAAELEKLVPGRTVNSRRIAVRRLKEGEGPQGSHVLFVGGHVPMASARAMVRAAQQAGALTVTDTGLESGAAINFVVGDNRVAFEVSLDAAERGGHRISSRMLAVARRVVQRPAS